MPANRTELDGPRILVLGRPGSGKGTQSARIARRFGVPYVSTGDLFRATVARDTPLGRTVRAYMHAGDLVPDDLVVELVDDALADHDTGAGFVLDGFPRTVTQAEQLVDLIDPHELDLAVQLVVTPEVARTRLLGRRVCQRCGHSADDRPEPAQCRQCGGALVSRADDVAATVSRRLSVHDQQSPPLFDWLAARHLLAPVDGDGSPDEVAARVDAACLRRLALDPVG